MSKSIKKPVFQVGFTIRVILAVFVVVALLGVVLLRQRGENSPINIRITNLSDRSVSISWITRERSIGEVVYSKGNLFPPLLESFFSLKAYDDRDVATFALRGEPGGRLDYQGVYYTHHVTISELDPGTTYQFRISDGKNLYNVGVAGVIGDYVDDNFAPVEELSFTTLKPIDEIFVPIPIYGSVKMKDNLDAVVPDAVVYYYVGGTKQEDSLLVSSPVNSEGNWYSDLSTVRSRDAGLYEIADEIANWEMVMVDGGPNLFAPPVKNSMINHSPMGDILLVKRGVDSQSQHFRPGLVPPVFARVTNNCCGDDVWRRDVLGKANCEGMGRSYDDPLNDWFVGYTACINKECALCRHYEPYCGEKDGVRICEAGENCVNCPEDCTCSGETVVRTVGHETSIYRGSGSGTNCSERSCNEPYQIRLNSDWCSTDIQGGGFTQCLCPGCNHGAANDCDCLCPDGFEGTKGESVVSAGDYCSRIGAGGSGGSIGVDGLPYCSVSYTACSNDPDYVANCVSGGRIPGGPELGDVIKCRDAGTNEEMCCCPENQKYCMSGGEPPPQNPCNNPNAICWFPEGWVHSGRDLCEGYRRTKLVPSYYEWCEDRQVCCAMTSLVDQLHVVKVDHCQDARLGEYSQGLMTYCLEKHLGCTTRVGNVTYICRRKPGFLISHHDTWEILQNYVSHVPAYPFAEPGATCDPCYDGYCAPGCACLGDRDSVTVIQKGETCQRSSASVNDRRLLVRSAHASDRTVDGGEAVFFPEEKAFSFESGGYYTITVDGRKFLAIVPDDITDGEKSTLFIDVNGNGQRDSNEPVIESKTYTVSVEKIKGIYSYEIQPGLNFVSFPFIPDGVEGQRASEFLKKLNQKYNNAFYSISAYDNRSGLWVTVELKDGTRYGFKDFQIVPGVGYLLKSKTSLLIEVEGVDVKSSVPVDLAPGWNLVAIHGGSSGYTAESFLNGVSRAGIDADNVSSWVSSKSLYEGFQKSRDSEGKPQVYGFDYLLQTRSAYFVRVENKKGVWLPE